MPKETIKQILMRRDGMASDDADELIADAREAFEQYLNGEDMDAAESICSEFFNLEPDYLDEFL